uniref:MAD2L1 binding protein n=1 Tax=Eptatretus burgeri TaxID=7764 RepID=A0A8C4R203_EPTBU
MYTCTYMCIYTPSVHPSIGTIHPLGPTCRTLMLPKQSPWLLGLVGDDMRGLRTEARECRVELAGAVARGGPFRFACDVIKYVLYERGQFPRPYDQLVMFESRRRPEARSLATSRIAHSGREAVQMLANMTELFEHLETLFFMSVVPRMLLLIGGGLMSPREVHELDMREMHVASSAKLHPGHCSREIFREIFRQDLFGALPPGTPTTTAIMFLAQRDCDVDWFHPKLSFHEPSRGMHPMIRLDGGDFVWFQAPLLLKGFQ